MKSPSILALASACIVFAAIPASAQKLYPLLGPAASQSPPPVLSGHLKRPLFGNGSEVKVLKSWTLPNGESFDGTCTEVTATPPNNKPPGTSESYPPQPNLAFAWDAVYGSGYFAAHILGVKIWQGIFKSNQGTILQVELRQQPNPERINNQRYKGAAVDNKGNVYKLVW